MTTTVDTTIESPQRSDVGRFLVLAFGLTWLFWIPMALAQRGMIDLPIPAMALAIIGGLGPMVAAIAMTARRRGTAGVKALFSQLRLRGVDRRWLWIALATGAIDLSPILVHIATGGALPDTILSQILVIPVHFLFVATVGGGLDEEMGWRGYALPRLQRRIPPLPANLILGALWTVWHLPLFFDPTMSHASANFGVYMGTVVCQAIVIGWLYNASGGSLLVAVIAHSAHNTADGLTLAVVEDGAKGDLIQFSVALLVAASVIILTRGRLGLPGSVPAPLTRQPTPTPS